jgi:hypothetical protein
MGDGIGLSNHAPQNISSEISPSEAIAGEPHFSYHVYGVSLHSEFMLSLPEETIPGLMEIEIRAGSPSMLAEVIRGVTLQHRSDWYHYARLQDGSSYVKWDGLGEFLVSSDGRRIICAHDTSAPMESFQVYLLGQALGFALVKSGFEPLHATAIDIGGEAIALLGASGFGKSSLAACFLAGGYSLLTDDLLLLRPGSQGVDAYPGPPRIKLFPRMARRFLGPKANGVPMNWGTDKMVVALDQRQIRQAPALLRAVYAITPPHETRGLRDITIEPLSEQGAFMALVANTFNCLLVDPERLQRQVSETSRLLGSVPVKKLTYPRKLKDLPSVREAILSDVRGCARRGEQA